MGIKNNVATFGTGDIKITSMRVDGDGAIALEQQEPHRIDEKVPNSRDAVTELSHADIILRFNKKESAEVFVAIALQMLLCINCQDQECEDMMKYSTFNERVQFFINNYNAD